MDQDEIDELILENRRLKIELKKCQKKFLQVMDLLDRYQNLTERSQKLLVNMRFKEIIKNIDK